MIVSVKSFGVKDRWLNRSLSYELSVSPVFDRRYF